MLSLKKKLLICGVAVVLISLVLLWLSTDRVRNASKRIYLPPTLLPARSRGSHKRGSVGLSSNVVFYNRVGKCGSRSLYSVAERLAPKNNFTFSHSRIYDDKRPDPEDMLQEILTISKLNGPTFYHRHIHFLDFEKYDLQKPIYINLIRDPIERYSSRYNYLKYGGPNKKTKTSGSKRFKLDINECLARKTEPCDESSFFEIGAYLCGFSTICTTPSAESAALAKKHVDEDYEFIGLTEEFENTVRILEKILPRFFTGAVEDWSNNLEMKNTTRSYKFDHINETLRETLRVHELAHEYEVYNHVKQKFDDLKRKFGIV